uniref:U3 small nucleolar RNA-associated protein 25 n=1 Tax=Kalanchoe fedtschenkoi TaxID=63787 RepID=A0A7N0TL50_KALFE
MGSKKRKAAEEVVANGARKLDDEEAEEVEVDNEAVIEASAVLSSFNSHFGYSMSKTEAESLEQLSRKERRYGWPLPAFGKSTLKWVGTEEWPLEASEDFSATRGIKSKLLKHWLDIMKTSEASDFDSSGHGSFLSLCNTYQNILHQNKKPFYVKGSHEDSSIMDAYIMHSLNHVLKTRDVITKNDAKLAKHQGSATEDILSNERYLDHSFTRPKVLILLPLASIAFRVIRRLIQLTPPNQKVNVEHMDRFSNEFGAGIVEEEEEKTSSLQKCNDSNSKSSKPSDFRALFDGNNNDHFMMGIKFTRKSIRLYSDFYSSDMIIASPLGLITKIGEAEDDKEKDVDYLSSIEILVIDHADVMAMQNWSHVKSVVEKMNQMPTKQHGTDVMRIKQWYLDGLSKYYRQTIVLGFYLTPDMNALFNHQCFSYQGKVKLDCEYKGVLHKILLQVRQIYERFDAESILVVDDARFKYFTDKVFPKIRDTVQGGIMIFMSSYLEFVRIRNFLKSQDASFCLLGE